MTVLSLLGNVSTVGVFFRPFPGLGKYEHIGS